MSETAGSSGSEEFQKQTGFVSTRDTGRSITLTREDMPWMPEEQTKARLTEATLPSGDIIYIASAVRGKPLEEAAGVARGVSDLTDKLFYRTVAAVAEGHSGIELQQSTAPHPIYRPRILLRKKGSSGDLEQSNPRHTIPYVMSISESKTPTYVRVALSSEKGNKKVQQKLSR